MADEVSQSQEQPAAQQELSDQELIEQQCSELDEVTDLLGELVEKCTQTLHATASFKNPSVVQEQLYVFSQSLALAPRSLQLLNDFRRHFSHIGQFSEQVRVMLIERRGGEEDALSSEEGRIIVSCGSSRDVVLSVISSLEDMLLGVRQHTTSLLELIAYDGDHFEEEALKVLPRVRIDLIGSRAHDARETLRYLSNDLRLLAKLASHARDLR